MHDRSMANDLLTLFVGGVSAPMRVILGQRP